MPWNVTPIPMPAAASPLDDANVACSSAIVMVPARVKLPAEPATVPTPGTFTCSAASGDTLTMVSAPTWRTVPLGVPVAVGVPDLLAELEQPPAPATTTAITHPAASAARSAPSPMPIPFGPPLPVAQG